MKSYYQPPTCSLNTEIIKYSNNNSSIQISYIDLVYCNIKQLVIYFAYSIIQVTHKGNFNARFLTDRASTEIKSINIYLD